MRKLLSLVLASSMVVSSFSMSFAAPITAEATTKLVENVKDDNVMKAVKRLSAFEIVDGMEDGEYHPEVQVTREQMAKLIVEALGLSSAVPAAKGTSSFKDVDANRWSTGYINVAYGQGIIKGSGDGNFNPTAEVTYAEAITMLVRALGYKDQFINDRGTWPSNYIAQAADLDITEDVTYAATGANRGDVAIMLNNTLDADVVKAISYGRNIVQGSDDDTRYATTGESLLENKLGYDKVSDLRIVGTPSLLEKLEDNEVTLKAIKADVEIDGKELKEGREKAYDTKVATDYLLGEDVTGYFDGDEMVYVETETDQDNVFRTLVKNDGDKAEDVVINGVDGKFGWDDNAVVYINNEKMDFDFEDADKDDKIDFEKDNLESEDSDYIFARKVVVENGDIMFLDAVKFETKNINLVVKNVNVDKKRINVFETYNDEEKDRDLKLDDYDDGFDIFTEDGHELGLEDLEKDDLIYLAEEEDEDRAHVIVAKDRSVTGDLENYRQGYDGKGKDRTSIKIDGESYDLADAFTFTDDNLDTLKRYQLNAADATKNDEQDYVMYNKFEEIFGEEIIVLRDLRGNVAFINSSVDATVDKYAVVLGADESYGDVQLKVWNTQGVVSYYKVDNDKLPLDKDHMDTLKNSIIKYDLTSNGDKIKIEEAYIVTNNKVTRGYGYEYYKGSDKTLLANYIMPASKINKVTVELNTNDTFERDSIKTDDGTYYNESDSVYLNYADFKSDKDEDDLEIFNWDELEGNDANGTSNALVLTNGDNNDVDLMVFINDKNIASSKLLTGYVAKVTRSKNKKTVEIDIAGEGTKTYVVDDNDTSYSKIVNETTILFSEKGTSIKLVNSDEDYIMVNKDFKEAAAKSGQHEGVIKDVDGRYIDIEGSQANNYKLSPDVVIYNDSDVKDRGDLVAASDKTIYVRFIAKGTEILALQYKDFDTKDMSDKTDEPDKGDTTVDVDKLKTKASDFATVAEMNDYIINLGTERTIAQHVIENDNSTATEFRNATILKKEIQEAEYILGQLVDEMRIVETQEGSLDNLVTAHRNIMTISNAVVASKEELIRTNEQVQEKVEDKIEEVENKLTPESAFNEVEDHGVFVVNDLDNTLKTAAIRTTGSAIELINTNLEGMDEDQLTTLKEDLVFRQREIESNVDKANEVIIAEKAKITEAKEAITAKEIVITEVKKELKDESERLNKLTSKELKVLIEAV